MIRAFWPTIFLLGFAACQDRNPEPRPAVDTPQVVDTPKATDALPPPLASAVVSTQDGAPSRCGSSTLYDAEVYAALTSTTWHQGGGGRRGMPLTSRVLNLSTDGTLSWSAMSDVNEGAAAGPWNFSALDATSGIVCMRDWIIPFRFKGDKLTFGAYHYNRGSANTSKGRPLKRSELSTQSPSALFVELARTPWTKTNKFNLNMHPTTLHLDENGTFEASYRAGECVAKGLWGLWGQVLIHISEDNVCDTRGGGTTAHFSNANAHPVIEDDLLRFFGNTYRRSTSKNARQLFYVGGHGNYGAQIEFSGSLVRGKSKTFDMLFGKIDSIRRSQQKMLLESISFSAYAVKASPGSDSMSRIGDKIVLFERKYDSISLVENPHRAKAKLKMPSEPHQYSLSVEAVMMGTSQLWTERASLLIDLR